MFIINVNNIKRYASDKFLKNQNKTHLNILIQTDLLRSILIWIIAIYAMCSFGGVLTTHTHG